VRTLSRCCCAGDGGVDPPWPPCRGRLQTTASCVVGNGGVVSVAEKADRVVRQVGAKKASESEPLMTC